jgi:hypothetical protein
MSVICAGSSTDLTLYDTFKEWSCKLETLEEKE